MRKQPGSPPPITQQQKDEIITQVREYQLITPLFGGGVMPNEADPITIIRGTEIRGQLRFWWRACRGGQFDGDHAKMKIAENALWGAAYTKDEKIPTHDETIQIVVETISTGKPVNPFKADGKPDPSSGIPDYAAFPLQPTDKDRREKEVLRDIRFILTISFPVAQKSEVEAALWAWETFGGIGARTRRGFGALHLLKIDSTNNSDLPLSGQAKDWIEKKTARFVTEENFPENVPHLSKVMRFEVTRPQRNDFGAWQLLISKLSNFRQAPDGRDGRSNWPEPEAIREITKRRYYKYNARSHANKFPRAAFGLPIIFHFKDQGDPEDSTLQGASKGNERLASPLILRPIHCKDGQAVGLAVLLEGSHIPPDGLHLIEKNGKAHLVDSMLTQKEVTTIPLLHGKTDVLQAFMDYLKKGVN